MEEQPRWNPRLKIAVELSGILPLGNAGKTCQHKHWREQHGAPYVVLARHGMRQTRGWFAMACCLKAAQAKHAPHIDSLAKRLQSKHKDERAKQMKVARLTTNLSRREKAS